MARASSLEDNFVTKVLEPRNLQSHGSCRYEEPDADKIIASAAVAVSSTMKISFLAQQGGPCFANEGSRNALRVRVRGCPLHGLEIHTGCQSSVPSERVFVCIWFRAYGV